MKENDVLFQKYLDKNGLISGMKLKKMPEEEKNSLLLKTNGRNIREAVYLEMNNMKLPKCQLCDNNALFRGGEVGFSPWCSVSCAVKGTVKRGKESHLSTPGNMEKRRITCLEKYGVDSPLKLKSVQEKRQQTCLEKYGATSFLGSNAGKEAVIKGVRDKYGVDYISQVKDLRKNSYNVFS